MFDGLPEKYETKPGVFSPEGLIAWLETQDPTTQYDYHDCSGHCLIAQYLAAHGYLWGDNHYGRFMSGVDRADIACTFPMTFGAALERARKLLAAR